MNGSPRVIVPEQPDTLRENDDIVAALRESIRTGNHGLGTIPLGIKRVLRDGCWRDRIVVRTGERVTFSNFAEFVATPPLEGLGASVETIRSLIRDDKEARRLLDKALELRPGERTDLSHNIREVRHRGTSREAALRKLSADRPDLLARVEANELSPHAAMIEAGFWRRKFTVPEDPEGIARTLRKRLPAAQRRRLIELLRDEGEP